MIKLPDSTVEGLAYVHSSHENIQVAIYGLLSLRKLCTAQNKELDSATLFGLLGPIISQFEYAANLLETHVDQVQKSEDTDAQADAGVSAKPAKLEKIA